MILLYFDMTVSCFAPLLIIIFEFTIYHYIEICVNDNILLYFFRANAGKADAKIDRKLAFRYNIFVCICGTNSKIYKKRTKTWKNMEYQKW